MGATMNTPPYKCRALMLAAAVVLVTAAAGPAWATQTHGEPEGLVAHQLAHVFFAFAMATLVFWLRRHHLTAAAGWRMIQYAGIMLIFWNVDAFIVHALDEQIRLLTVTQLDTWTVHIETLPGQEILATVYYIAKLDHLICVPALLLLYLGLRRLASDSHPTSKPENTP